MRLQRKCTERAIDPTDREIDRIVYELYGLTEEEITVVEKNYMNGEIQIGKAGIYVILLCGEDRTY